MHGISVSVILIAAAGIFIGLFVPMIRDERLMNVYSRSAWGAIGLAVFWLAMLYDYRTEVVGTIKLFRPESVSTVELKPPALPDATVIVPFILAAVAIFMTLAVCRRGVFAIVSWIAVIATTSLDGVAAATFRLADGTWMTYVRIMAFLAIAMMILACIFAGPKSSELRR